MKSVKKAMLFGAVCLFTTLAACQGGKNTDAPKTDNPAAQGDVVARVGEVSISLEEFEKLINQQNRLVRTRYKSVEQKRKFLQSLVEREAMVAEAMRLGLDKDQEVVRGYKKILARFLVNQEFNQKRAKQIQIADEEIQKYYQENHDRYHSAEKVRVHRIFFSGPKKDAKLRKEARARAKKVLAQLQAKPQDRRLFIQLAREKSEDEATKRIGGDTNFKTQAQLEDAFGKQLATTAFALKQTNEISAIIEEEQGVSILRQSGKQPAIDLPLEKVREQIRTTLFARARGDSYKAYVAELKEKAKVVIFDKQVEQAKVDLSDAPTMPNNAKPRLQMPGKGPIQIQPSKSGQVKPRALPPQLRTGKIQRPPKPVRKP